MHLLGVPIVMPGIIIFDIFVILQLYNDQNGILDNTIINRPGKLSLLLQICLNLTSLAFRFKITFGFFAARLPGLVVVVTGFVAGLSVLAHCHFSFLLPLILSLPLPLAFAISLRTIAAIAFFKSRSRFFFAVICFCRSFLL